MPEIKIPTAPKHLPKSIAAKWTKIFTDTLAASKGDTSLSESMKRAAALRAANTFLKITPPVNYDEAVALVKAKQAGKDEAWSLLLHGDRTKDGDPHLALVMADGKKHYYKKPAEKAAPNAGAGGNGNQ